MEFFENSATVCSFENIPTGEYLFESYISFTFHDLTFLFGSLTMEQTTAKFLNTLKIPVGIPTWIQITKVARFWEANMMPINNNTGCRVSSLGLQN